MASGEGATTSGFNASIESAPPLYDDVAPDAPPPAYNPSAPPQYEAPPTDPGAAYQVDYQQASEQQPMVYQQPSPGMQQPAVYQQPPPGGPQPVMYQQEAAPPQPVVYQQQQPPAQQVVYQQQPQQQPVQQVVYQQPVNAGYPAASKPQPQQQVVYVMQPQTDGGPPGPVVAQQPTHGAPQPVVYQQAGPVGAAHHRESQNVQCTPGTIYIIGMSVKSALLPYLQFR